MPTAKKTAKSTTEPVAVPSRYVEGITVKELFKVSRQMGMSPEQFDRLSGYSSSKLRRGRGGEETVAAERLEGFQRCEKIFNRALALCGGNEAAAVQWVSAYAPALNGRKPIEAAETANGAKTVEKLLSQLEGAVGGA